MINFQLQEVIWLVAYEDEGNIRLFLTLCIETNTDL